MRRRLGIAGIVILLVSAFGLGLGVTRGHDGRPGLLNAGPRDAPPKPIDEVRTELLSNYYRVVSSKVLERPTIDEVIEGLEDPYTDYLTPAEYAELRQRTAQSYAGLGLTVGPAKNGLVVKAALQGPARAAGIQPGDRILSIDGRRVRRLAFGRSVELMQGEAGTTVRLTIRRPRAGMLSVAVKRKEIQLPAVRARLVEAKGGPLGYVRVVTFRARATESVTTRVDGLLASGARGIVLDLRDNPGGLLSEAVGTVSLFLASGAVCVIEGVNRGTTEYGVRGDARFAGVPLVVLVDGGSASAAEVVAAALSEHGRASVVGVPTFGKASVQSIRELSNGAALKLTTAVFLTPRGLNLSAGGLTPDVRAVDAPRTVRDEALDRATRVLLKQLAG